MKYLQLKNAWLVKDNEVVTCYAKEIATDDMWGENSNEYLVLVDDKVSIIGKHKREVHFDSGSAHKVLNQKIDSRLRHAQEQLENYQKLVKELS